MTPAGDEAAYVRLRHFPVARDLSGREVEQAVRQRFEDRAQEGGRG